MPSLKVLKGVAHNLGHHYLSAMNWQHNDYVLNHLRRRAWETRRDRIEIDILNLSIQPAGFSNSVIEESVELLKQFLTYLLGTQNLPANSVQGAKLVLAFQFPEGVEPAYPEGLGIDAYTCEVTLVDQRGKEYRASVSEGFLNSISPDRQHNDPPS